MRRVLLDEAVAVGDYLEVASERVTPDRRRRGEEYLRVEWVEHIARPAFLDPASKQIRTRFAARDVVVAVLCEGMPGAVLLRGGDHHVSTAVERARQTWDAGHPSWPVRREPLFVGGEVPRHRHGDRARLEADAAEDDEDTEEPAHRSAVAVRRLRAAAFTKAAGEVMVGDYVQIHAERSPADVMGVDEGFHRVEWAGHLPPERAGGLLADPAWARGAVTLLSVHGVPGLLVLPETDVRVLVQPNPERIAADQRERWHDGPVYELTGMTVPDVETLRRGDAARRPSAPADEASLYPSMFTDPHHRALHLSGTTGVRPVAATELPWPHSLFKCPYAERAKALARTYPDTPGVAQVAHAELFLQLHPEEFAACPYHQADDWEAIAQAVLAHAEAEQAGEDDRAEELYAMEHLSERDRKWARQMVADHLWWDEGQTRITNGQHRVCAMRAAGVTSLPVYGRYLPDRTPAATTDAKRHARQAITAFWTDHLTALWGPRSWRPRLGPALARYRFLRGLLPQGDRQATPRKSSVRN